MSIQIFVRHTKLHKQFTRFLRSFHQVKQKKGKAVLMMKTYDFECDTCGKVFEQLLTEDLHTLPCTAKACTGRAARKLGGHPIGSVSSSSVQPNMGGYTCHDEVVAFSPMAETKIGEQTVKVGVALVEHTHKPKTSA